ncbi:MAG: SAM-dependent methyltransferase [Chromatiaceae bacterium]|nr:MAG: SAM-dependent methyltransferase [Chromatiaceae bacterium]
MTERQSGRDPAAAALAKADGAVDQGSAPTGELLNVRRNDAAGARISAQLQTAIGAAIDAAGGRLPFDRFMELALYAPGLGYYSAGAVKLGPAGDFVTAPELSPLFGRCLAAQAAEILAALRASGHGPVQILEFGAGSGALAGELLTALAAAGMSPDAYLILEPSADLAARQREHLATRVPNLARVHWLQRLPANVSGLVIANEVLDAMPVHRFCIDAAGAIQEVFVTRTDAGLAECSAPPVSPGLAAAVGALQAAGLALAPGYCSEINLRAAPWLRALAAALTAGLVLICDYGYPRHEFYAPARRTGTLLCHHRHRAHTDPYVHIGLQDITAHVDFSALAAAGRAAGLDLAGYTTQAHFLLGCGIDDLLTTAAETADPLTLAKLNAGARQLLLPTQMGERFQFLGLARQLPADLIPCGFSIRDLRHRL